MSTESLIDLAALAGRTVVAAASTDAWEAARKGFARLIGRRNPEQVQLVGQRLEQTRNQLADREGAELDHVRLTLVAQWTARLADLLEEAPDVVTDLCTLVQQIQRALPAGLVSAVDHAIAAGGNVDLKADHGGVAAGVIHGNVVPANPPGPSPANGQQDPGSAA